jgi:hypothetical protein
MRINTFSKRGIRHIIVCPPPLKKREGGGWGGKNLAINKNSGELLTMEEPDFYEIKRSWKTLQILHMVTISFHF